LRDHDGLQDNPRYTDPQTVVQAIYDDQAAPPADAEVFEFTIVAHARKVVQDWASNAGLPAERVTDLVIAISEIGGNSVVHGGQHARLIRWTDNGWLVCEVRDQGHIADPLAGRLPPPETMESGRGLLMVNHLCDLVQIKTGPSGTAIRLWMGLP
jgi:anti-sigma regulatory factor (Ser/Thr protein kinase)